MRGRRFGRPAMKKTSTKTKRETSESTIFYEESVPVNPTQILSNTLNSLEHLGKQRFVLPPFAEHFERWTKDLRAVLSEFETALPSALDQQGKERVESAMNSLQVALSQVTSVENKTSSEMADVQRELFSCESELSKLEHDYKNITSHLRRRGEQSFEKLRRDISALDKERLQQLHAKPTFFQRIFRKPDMKLEEKTVALQARKNNLTGGKEQLKRDLEKYRANHEKRRNELTARIEALRERMFENKGRTADDALELRGKACMQLSQTMRDAVDRFLKETVPERTQEDGQTSL